MLPVVATAASSSQTNSCPESVGRRRKFWIGSAPGRAIGSFLSSSSRGCPVAPYGQSFGWASWPPSQLCDDRLPNGQRDLGQLGAEVGRDGSPQPAGELFPTSRKNHASPSLWSCVRQPRRRQRSIKNGNMVVTISCLPPFVSFASAHESPINLLHARIRLLDLQPRPPRPGLAGCSWLYSFRLGGSRKIATQNTLLKEPPRRLFRALANQIGAEHFGWGLFAPDSGCTPGHST